MKYQIAIISLFVASTSPSFALLGGILPGIGGNTPPTSPGFNASAQAELQLPLINNKKGQLKPKDSQAPSQVYLGEVSFSGSGCSQKTASVALTPNKRAVSIVFDQFTAEAGADVARIIDRKNCQIVIPIIAPKGYRMAVAQLDYRGFKGLPPQAQAQFKTFHQIRYPLLNLLGPKVTTTQNYNGPDAEDFFLSAQINNKPALGIGLPISTPITDPLLNPILKTCGGTYNLEINADLAVKANSQNEQTLLTLDSVDGELLEGMKYHLQWEKCQTL